MSVWKRTLAAFLSVVLLAGLLPISVFAQETEDDKENVGYIVINETVKIRTDTGAVEEGSLPTGVSYSGGTLTLNNASLKSLNAFGGDGFTIQLEGSNAIALDDNTADTDRGAETGRLRRRRHSGRRQSDHHFSGGGHCV